MKILIIEDETRAASQLQRMLKACSFDYELLGIIDTVEDAVQWFQKNATPDLVFMDIQLADGLSFEIFQKVPGVFFLLGGSDIEKGIISMPHTPNFAVDEKTIKYGVQSFATLIFERTNSK